MLVSRIGTAILNGLFGNNIGGKIEFDGDIYLGLLTKLPNDNGAAYEDGTYFSEPTDTGYFRVKLNANSRITKGPFIASAVEGDAVAVGEDMGTPAYVTNQAMILFPESNEDWDTVVGFGLFRALSGTDLPFLWGSVTSTDGEEGVTIKQYEVPVIRVGGFKVTMM